MPDCSICGKTLKRGQVNKCQNCQEIVSGSKKRTTRKDYSSMASGRGAFAQGGGGGGQMGTQRVRGGQGQAVGMDFGDDMSLGQLSAMSSMSDISFGAQAPKASRGRKKQQPKTTGRGGGGGGGDDYSLGSFTGDFLAWANAQKHQQQDTQFKALAGTMAPTFVSGSTQKPYSDIKYIPELKVTIHYTAIKNPLRGIRNYSVDDPVFPIFDNKATMKYICFFDGNVFDMGGNFIGKLDFNSL